MFIVQGARVRSWRSSSDNQQGEVVGLSGVH